jgi:hypothetical protein
MSLRIRGQEVTVRLSVDQEPQKGTFLKVSDFTVTPRQEIKEDDFLGELESDLDFMHHGFDFSFSCQVQDESAINFLENIVEANRNADPHPDITMTVIYKFREADAKNKVEVYHQVFMKVDDTGFGGRKDYVKTKFSGKCKRRSVSSA